MSELLILDPRWRRLARLRLYCNAASIFSICFGGVVLCGWIFQIAALKSFFLGSQAISLDTSVGFILLGTSLWLLLPDPPRAVRRYWGLFFASVAASLGGITAIECAFGFNLRTGESLLSWQGSVDALLSGRMTPVDAITFLVLGLALLLLDWEARPLKRSAQALSLWGAFVGIMSLSGFINGATATFKVFSYTQADVATSLVLFAISGGIFFARPRAGFAGDLTGQSSGSSMARRFLPAVIIVPIFAAWLRMQLQRAGFFDAELGRAFNVTVNIVTLGFLVWLDARKLNRAEQSLEEVRKAKEVLFDASLRDELTGLYNRRGFLTFAEEHIKLACSGRRELLVVFADVDGLKEINDRHGHSEGDRALKKAAELLLTVFRDTDLVARLGGDEFAALALDCSPAGMTRINAHFEKLLRAINKLDNPWKLNISIGATHVDSGHPLSISELLRQADQLMYERKRSRFAMAAQ